MRGYILKMLISKDLRDLRKNMSALPLVLMAPLLAFLYSKLDVPQEMMFPIWVAYGLGMVGIMLPGMALAEEKEKKTLDSLLVSPATPHEIIVGKVLFTLLIVIFVTVLVVLPYLNVVQDYGILFLVTVLGATFFIQVGLIISLFTENQVSANAFMTPAMLVALLAPLLISIFPEIVRQVLEYLPSIAILKALGANLFGEAEAIVSTAPVWPQIINLLAWNVVAYFFTMWGVRHQFE